MKAIIPALLMAGAVAFAPSVSWSQASLGEFLVCGAGSETPYIDGSADYVNTFKFRGVVMHDDLEHHLHSASVTCHGERHRHPTEGHPIYSSGSCKIVDDEGHTFVFEDTKNQDDELVRRWIYAFGKWEGIDSNLSMDTVAISGPRPNGEYEVCLRVTEE